MGIVLAVFMLVFCVSGIILNHRQLFAGCNVSRSLLPGSYHIDGWNNGILRGTLSVGPDSVVAYGCAGVWTTNRRVTVWHDCNAGLPAGADQRGVRNVVRAKDGTLWCVTNYAVYQHRGGQWQAFDFDHAGERLTDLTLNADSTRLVVLSRSRVYTVALTQGNRVTTATLRPAKGYEPKETLFRTVWKLHSGELFGMAGRLVVDAIAIVLIVLSLTGIWLFICPYAIRRLKRRGGKEAGRKAARSMAWNQRWHNRVGAWTVVLTLLVTVTGTCLRPPYMIPLAMTKTAPLDGDPGNVYHDKLRAIRWDNATRQWLISTSGGFLLADQSLTGEPRLLNRMAAPTISPMGVNVFQQSPDSTWLVGSFSGLFRWDTRSGLITDYATGQPVVQPRGMGLGGSVVTGYSADFATPQPVVFEYSRAAAGMPRMPEVLRRQPLSLWNVALELHVGRCYAPLLGPLSEMFVFLFGTLIVLIVISGYIVYRRQISKNNHSINSQKRKEK